MESINVNIHPNTFADFNRAIALLQTQVSELYTLIGRRADAPRDTSVAGFCRRQGISRGTYQNLRKIGKGPVEARTANRIIITEQAEADWVAARQADALEMSAARRTKAQTPPAPAIKRRRLVPPAEREARL
jgi:hypothetical protein